MQTDLFPQIAMSGATFSEDRIYRYSLWRKFSEDAAAPNWIHFCLLNPSTADSEANDPTVSRCIVRAKALGYTGMLLTNAFAFRSTDPEAMLAADEPVGGAENNAAILDAAKQASITILGWGNHGLHRGRAAQVLELLEGFDLYALKINENGQPSHPLYLNYLLQPIEYLRAI